MRIDFWSEWQDLNLILDEALLLHRQIKALDARRRTDIDGCEALIAGRAVAERSSNSLLPFCYPTRQHGLVRTGTGQRFEQNPLDNSVLAGTEQNTK
jgi:hypothetical protein